VKRQKEKRYLIHFKGFAQIEINDIGLLRFVFDNETTQRIKGDVVDKRYKPTYEYKMRKKNRFGIYSW
jgi:hypothetical protein